ncbi:unnamed protein product [Gadus morhua 'NCC']
MRCCAQWPQPPVQVTRRRRADYSAFGTDSLTRKRNTTTAVLSAVLLRPDAARRRPPPVLISLPRDFRPVSSIIDVDILPESHRRVRLYKHGQERPLGFYIRDGSSVRVTAHGLEKVPGIFISRMVPGGLAEGTGLLAVNDEVLEVNGIEVSGKSLDQVTDMMIANSHNLIVTVKPANQRNNVLRAGGGGGGGAGGGMSGSSGRSSDSGASYYGYGAASQAPVLQDFPAGEELESEDEEEDLVIDAAAAAAAAAGGGGGGDDVSLSALPRYEPHLGMRTASAASVADSNGAPPSHAPPHALPHLYTHPAGALFGSAPRLATSTPSPERAARRRSLEEEGTVITL